MDLALLQVEPPGGEQPLCVLLSETCQSGDQLYVYGYPDNLPDGSPVTLECEGEAQDKGFTLIRAKAGWVRPGLSGSPALNWATGRVCGVVSETLSRSMDLGGLLIPVSAVFSHFPDLPAQNQAAHPSDSPWLTLPLPAQAESRSRRAAQPPQFSAYNPATFAGRTAETSTLTNCLRGSCRILAITGMTGIGKTALAERVVAQVIEATAAEMLSYYRFSLDILSLTPDFASSGAALLRTLGEEPTLEDQKDPANLLEHLLDRLCQNPCRVQIDSLERLLRGNEQEGWSEFCDPLWLELLQRLLTLTDCSSQLLLTSQDIPGDLDAVASRSPQFWYCEPLQGLNSEEQRILFQNLGLIPAERVQSVPVSEAGEIPPAAPTPLVRGLQTSQNSMQPSSSQPPAASPSLPRGEEEISGLTHLEDWEILQRIGAHYDGHPLVLQVIAEEIRQPPFWGDIARYWQYYEAEFSSSAPTTANKLERSRLFRRRVQQRVEQAIQRLPESARQMLCACSVFRRPVPEGFWLAMVVVEDALAAFDMLQERGLVEYASAAGNTLLVRQHNLIRSVAFNLLKADSVSWEAAERRAAHLWLNDYEPEPDAPNLETVRGYLEAFDHYWLIADWEAMHSISKTPLATEIQYCLPKQLSIWGYISESIVLNHKRLESSQKTSNDTRKCEATLGLGLSYIELAEYKHATNFLEDGLVLAKELRDLRLEMNFLLALGYLHNNTINPKEALKYHGEALFLSKQLRDRQSEGAVLGNMGAAYRDLGEYSKSIELFQECLEISNETNDVLRQGRALGALGEIHFEFKDYELAIYLIRESMKISKEIGDFQSKGYSLNALGGIHIRQGDYNQALNSLLEALTLSHETKALRLENYVQSNLGLVYLSLDKPKKAIECYQRKLDISQKTNNHKSKGIALVNLGEIQCRLGQYSNSSLYNQAALEIFREIGFRDGEAEAIKNLSELHQALGEIETAKQYAQQALALATELGIPLQAECEALLAELEKEQTS
ncbi:MAG: tetratricopeptide repeat protein [Cyanobacteria bacterium P01_G01_bin.54]